MNFYKENKSNTKNMKNSMNVLRELKRHELKTWLDIANLEV